ncbi:hypothetical protein U1Q18_008651 [Sarracenia purpurea var. burkii]
MDRNGFLTLIFLVFIVSDSSSAYSIWSFRKLIGVAPMDDSPATNISPLPSPITSSEESKASPIDGDKSGSNKTKDSKSFNDSAKVNPNGPKSDDHNLASGSPSIGKQIVDEKNHEGKEKTDSESYSHADGNWSCKESTNNCSIQKTLIACVQGSEDLMLLIQNEQESTLQVNITIATSLERVLNEHEIPKHQTKRVNVSLNIGQSTQIVLNTSNGECMLHMGPNLSKGNLSQWLPSYYKQVNPIYGAYLLFPIALVVGGTWACCIFRKRRRQDGGVPYQELEMGFPQTSSAVNVNAAEGWDEGWDDDWDEDKAVKSPGGRRVGSISASGLTARSSNREGWEKDWND